MILLLMIIISMIMVMAIKRRKKKIYAAVLIIRIIIITKILTIAIYYGTNTDNEINLRHCPHPKKINKSTKNKQIKKENHFP